MKYPGITRPLFRTLTIADAGLRIPLRKLLPKFFDKYRQSQLYKTLTAVR
jgi:hypothetical protein